MAEREFIARGSCRVWISMDEGRLRLTGQDLGGFMGTSEYEYVVTIEPEHVDLLRSALKAHPDADIVDAMCANAAAIYSRGETTWLTDHGVPHELSTWHSFDD